MPNHSAKPATLAYTVWSWPWNRHGPLRAVLYARALGLTAETLDDGGWLLRYHLITVTGHQHAVTRYDRTMRYFQRGGPPPKPPRQHRDLLVKLRTARPPADTSGDTHAGP